MSNKKIDNIKPGDKVIYKHSFSRGEIVTVVSISHQNEFGQLSMFPEIQVKTKDGNLRNIYEHDIELIPAGVTYINTDMLACECGLKFVRDGGRHSSWCPMSNYDPLR